jgi:transcription-repair coupling factor (superfamily II helicase)
VWKRVQQRTLLLGESTLHASRFTLHAPSLHSLEFYRPVGVRAIDEAVAEVQRRTFFQQLRQWVTDGYAVQVFCNNEGEQQRFFEILAELGMKDVPLHAQRGSLSQGFLFEEAKLVVVTDAEIFGRYKVPRPRRLIAVAKEKAQTKQLIDFTELEEGDFVVHIQHGIGKFLGLKKLESGGAEQEVLAIGYANDARLYVPVAEAHLVSKYVGVGKRFPELSQIGGTRWARAKESAERAIVDLAAGLLEIQAARETQTGFAYPPDTAWQREFESAFLYEETSDQWTAITDVKRDMEAKKPMDRLICGDVGYGKTEVAIRAAFKAVMAGKQVAVLVPTTVLAQQHFNTFTERMADYPVRIEMLSRFRTKGEQRRIVQLLREGGMDIVIGTHRLVQPDVHFKDLGLVVIDEEQRFGVLHKERFKQLRRMVDVITLSATPIPRTLYLSLTGARDMSVIETPPQDRLPVETIITEWNERTIRDALVRELNRGGQVYFLHNRVESIEGIRDRLKDLLREFDRKVRIEIGHGQMHEDDLESVMLRFVNAEIDILVCTTIIESGLDIPNVNTIIIDRADRFGLSDLYQLRGRVGRWKHKAYAYLLIPRHAALVADARKRITAIQQYSKLGSGFKIAMRDLEIRGAGNILGAEQSGHITAVGFDLYCQLLRETIARLKGQPIKKRAEVSVRLDFLTLLADHAEEGRTLAAIPQHYISDQKLRVDAYRRIAQIADEEDVKRLRRECADRFGKLPRSVELLLEVAWLKAAASETNITTVEVKDDKVMLTRGGEYITLGGKFPRLSAKDAAGKLREMRKLIRSL